MGSTIKRVGRGFEKLGSGALNALTFGLFETPESPKIPKIPNEIPGDVSAEDRRRIQRQRRKQGERQGRAGTILGGATDSTTTLAPSSTILGQ